MVAASVVTSIFAARLFGILISTPRYSPDEYFYMTLSCSLWSGSFPSVRRARRVRVSVGADGFRAAWLVDGSRRVSDRAQRVCLRSHWPRSCIFLAARIGLGDRERVVAAVFAVVIPMRSMRVMLSEPFAYPLFLTVVLLAVEAPAAPSAETAVFVVVCALLVFARAQSPCSRWPTSVRAGHAPGT